MAQNGDAVIENRAASAASPAPTMPTNRPNPLPENSEIAPMSWIAPITIEAQPQPCRSVMMYVASCVKNFELLTAAMPQTMSRMPAMVSRIAACGGMDRRSRPA